jgi:hypothetical protein
MSEPEPQRVTVIDLDVPFTSLVRLVVKLFAAQVVAMAALVLAAFAATQAVTWGTILLGVLVGGLS